MGRDETTKEQIEEIEKLAKKGFSDDYIADALNIGRGTCQRYATEFWKKAMENRKPKKELVLTETIKGVFDCDTCHDTGKILAGEWLTDCCKKYVNGVCCGAVKAYENYKKVPCEMCTKVVLQEKM